ncbi:MAG: UDP-N-acetylmuramate dehydrogenase [Firmicutes bacterium]|nr:UDP-N-acetylmuramate dehydrogenase [Bacillota bacterium]
MLLDEPMWAHTSLKVGGPVDVMLMPTSAEEVCQVLHLLKEHDIPRYIMGNGSNLLVRDGGIRGVVIKLGDNFSDAVVEGSRIRAQAGISLTKLAHMAWQGGLTGLEFASGIPGSLGGAIAMNAGAYGGEMADVLEKVVCCNLDGNMSTLDLPALELGYRSSKVRNEKLVALEAVVALKPGDRTLIRDTMDDLNRRRREKQPLNFASAGSTFKRPSGYFAGKLIDDAGLRGICVGDAQVSDLHCGFVVNRGRATANELLELIDLIRQQVWDKYQVELELEVQVVGED